MQEKVGNPPVGEDYRWIGTRPVRPDGVDKVTGRAKFGADYNLPRQPTCRSTQSVRADGANEEPGPSAVQA
ncbi:MAG: hypothetical protein AAFR01_01320, partial [Pseudomonadota bacterium]